MRIEANHREIQQEPGNSLTNLWWYPTSELTCCCYAIVIAFLRKVWYSYIHTTSSIIIVWVISAQRRRAMSRHSYTIRVSTRTAVCPFPAKLCSVSETTCSVSGEGGVATGNTANKQTLVLEKWNKTYPETAYCSPSAMRSLCTNDSLLYYT